MQVAIIGNGISANLAALYLRRSLPAEARIAIVGPDGRGGLPLVGESLIEVSTRFMEEQLGLAEHLSTNHNPKYALTYYFKLDPSDPAARDYSVHCNERGAHGRPPLPSWRGPGEAPPAWLIDRGKFDGHIRSVVTADEGIQRIEGLVTGVELDGESGHELSIEEPGGARQRLRADWVIDASGRKRFLGKKLGLLERPQTGQRSCFWFWLEDFDRSHLTNLNALGPNPPAEGEDYHYDRYYTTHHFMGPGNWIWLIPLKTDDGSEKMSIGITWRPDVFPHDIKSVEEFLERVTEMHPVVADLVRSGTTTDTHKLSSYRYSVDKAYSPDRWCIIGDAAVALDPLFSNGLAFCTIQLEQIGEMIAQDCEGRLSEDFITMLDRMFWAPVRNSQEAITSWYEYMHDPLLSAMRLHWIEVSYFYILLPMVVNRCHYDPERISLWNILRDRERPFDVPKALRELRATVDQTTDECFVYRGKEKVNPQALDVVDNLRQVRAQMLEGAQILARYQAELTTVLERVRAGAPAPKPRAEDS